MYQVFCDDTLIYDLRDEELTLLEPKVTLEMNKAGSFSFKFPPDHPHIDLPQKMKSLIVVKQDGEEIFSGRPTKSYTDFYKRRYVYCEGELAYLNDSIQRPAEYHNMTVRGYLETLIQAHNEQVTEDKRFEVGIVTVTDPNDSLYRYTNYNSTMKELKEDLVDDLGGYLRVRNHLGHKYLDYVTDFGNTCTQVIEFGENLLDFTQNFDATNIATAIIPLGSKLETSQFTAIDERQTIKEVNDGKDYVYSEDAVKQYGWIFKTMTWDAVNNPKILMSKGKKYLTDTQFENVTIEAKAIDLHLTDAEIEQFKLGDSVRVLSSPHGLDRYFPLTKMTVNLDKPANNTVTLGITEKKSLTAVSSTINDKTNNAANNILNKSAILKEAQDQATALITAATHGHVVTTANEQLIMDTDDVKTATKVWRWNLNGLGYSKTGYNGTYETAITMDGSIAGERLTAGSVAADKLSVAYKQSVEKSISDSATKATNAANENTANSLKFYYTKQETETVIQNSAQQILLAAQKNSENYVDNQLTNYTTSAQLTVATNNIMLQVSEKYATQDSLGNYTKTSEIRSKFALDPSSVTIESGLVTFKSDTLVIDSTNFKLSKGGAVNATGSFRTPGAVSSGMGAYGRMDMSGFQLYKWPSDKTEADKTQAAAITSVYGELKGWIEVDEAGVKSASMIAGVGAGFRVYAADGAKSVFYANRDNAGNGAMGILNSEGRRKVSVSCDVNGNGLFSLYNKLDKQFISLWANSDGEPWLSMYGTNSNLLFTAHPDSNGHEQLSLYSSSQKNYFTTQLTSNGDPNIIIAAADGSNRITMYSFGDRSFLTLWNPGSTAGSPIIENWGGSRVGYFEKLGIAGGAAQNVEWVWDGAIARWVLCSKQ